MELWVEKYRPTTLNEYVGNETIKNKIADYLKQGSIQNLLLHGVAGTGKTTLAKLISKNLDCDLLYINASNERGIDTIRDKIIPFASSMSFKPVKIIILDEADYITPQAQATLRNTMESFSKTTRFILTCNYLERIISPLQSRCQTFEIIPPSKEAVIDLTDRIAVEEGVGSGGVRADVNVLSVVDTHYPDIRKIINTIQGSIVDGEIKIDNNSLKNTQLGGLVVDALIRKTNLTELRQILADSGAREFDDLFKYIYGKSSTLFGINEGEAILIIAQYQYEYTFVLEKEICIAAMLNKLLKLC
jgi:replication factor C small subunit|tara:strand:- start:1045 stop:1953 length:909 start_codon:yes stop_codon:yes gene_type:complete